MYYFVQLLLQVTISISQFGSFTASLKKNIIMEAFKPVQ